MTPISAFDLDHTLICKNSSLLFFRHLIRCGVFHPISMIRALFCSMEYNMCRLDLSELHRRVFNRFLKGRKMAWIEKEVGDFLQADFYRFVYFPSFLRLRRAQHEGHCTVILSNSPSFLVGPIAKYLGVSLWRASEYLTDHQGELQAVKSVLSGEGKAKYLKELATALETDSDKVVAYSDSYLDLPFLSAAGKAVVVKPNRRMRRLSKKKGWEII